MADAGVIKEFLVGLGFKINQKGQRDFKEALDGAQKAALGLIAGLSAVVAAVGKVAQSYEQLGYASERAQSSVSGMQRFAFAISQVGGNADSARASLQSIGNFLRSAPGGEGFIQRLGVQTRDAHGHLRDTAAIMSDMGSHFRTMPYWRARASAGVLGIDENTLQAMMRGGQGQWQSRYAEIYRRLGVDQNKAAKASHHFMQELRDLGVVFQAVRDKVAITLMPVLERFRDFCFHMYDSFTHLSTATKIWVFAIGSAVVAWRLLNTAFMQSPVGRVFALGAALLALYDDYKSWQSGAKSLINWKEWQPGIDALQDGVKQVGILLKELWPDVEPALAPLGNFFRNILVDSLKATGHAISGIAKALDNIAHGRFRAAWGNIMDMTQEGVGNLKNIGQSGAGLLSSGIGALSGMDAGKVNTAMQYLTDQGIDREHALAMIGNWQQESGLLNPERTDKGHFGLEQWEPYRRDTILKNLGIDVKKAGFLDQMKAAVWELRNGPESKKWDGFLKTSGMSDAAAFFAKNIERSGEKPGDPGFDSRIAYAAKAASISNFNTLAGSHAPTVNQTVNITSNGNPAAIASAVHGATTHALNTAVRNMKARRQ